MFYLQRCFFDAGEFSDFKEHTIFDFFKGMMVMGRR